MNTPLATQQDLQPMATMRQLELLRQEISLLRLEVADLRGQNLAKLEFSATLYLGSIFFTGWVLLIAFLPHPT